MNNETMRPMTQQEKIAKLQETSIPMDPIGAFFSISTTTLANKIVDMMANSFGIQECDHVFIKPEKSRDGRLNGFGVWMYFDTGRTRGNGNWSIRRQGVSGKGNKARDLGGGRIDLSGAFGAKSFTGGFELSESFKKTIGSITILNDNNQIVVRADAQNKQIAVVELDFFKLISICLGIDTNSPYDYAIVDCLPKNNSKDCLDYELQILKEIRKGDQRRGKSGMNYEFRDRQLMRG